MIDNQPDQRPLCGASACTRPQAPGIRLCAPDSDRLGQWIARIGDEYAQLSAVPSMQAREAYTGGAGGLASQRSVGDLSVMSLRDRRSRDRDEEDPDGNGVRGVLEVLESWARVIREERGIATPTHALAYVRADRPAGPVCDPQQPVCRHTTCRQWTWRGRGLTHATVSSERRLVATHLDWALTQDWCDELYRDIRQVWGLLTARNNPQPYTARRSCACGGQIRWRDGAAECGSCGTRTTGLDVIRQQGEGAVA